MEGSSLAPPFSLASGKLENGVAYYIWNHPEPRSHCELRLCVAVGSWFEDDNESGLAHFVEHMAFKTTTRFTEMGSVIRFLEAQGAQYGHDLNASTSLFDTTYCFQLPGESGLDHGLDVLAEWAFGIRATEEDVDNERPVILEEWRMKRGPKERLKSDYWARAVTPRVAARFPIGDLDVIKNAKPTDVRNFYKRWYRPELMAVVVTGDLQERSLEEVTAAITQRFGSAAGTGPKPSLLAPPVPETGLLTCFLQDAEVTACTAALELLHPLHPSADVTHLENEVSRRLLTTILDRRFAALIRQGSKSFICPPCILDLAVASRPLLPTLLCTSVTATVTTESGAVQSAVLSALTLLARELTRIASHGVLKSELHRATISWKAAFSADRAVASAELAEECLQHFRLSGQVPLAGPKAEAAACRAFLESTDRTQAAVWQLAQEFLPGNNGAWRVCVQCGPGPVLDVDALWSKAAAAVAAEFPPAWQDGSSDTTDALRVQEDALTSKLAQTDSYFDRHTVQASGGNSYSGSAELKMHNFTSLGATEFTLRNGLTAVALRRKTPGKIAFQAFALGGSTELDEFDECAMGVLDEIVLAAGLGDGLDGVALAELQSASQTRINTQRHLYHRGVGGSTTTGRLDLLLKLLVGRLKLAEEQLHGQNSAAAAAAIARMQARFAEDIRQRQNSPQFELGQRARILSCDGLDLPVLRPVSTEALAALSLERCANLQRRAFSEAPASFTFVFVGDLPPDPELGCLLESQLGRLTNGSGSWLQPGVATPQLLPERFAQGIVQERFCTKSVEKATVLLIFHVAVPREDAGEDHLNDILALQAACRCGSERLLSKLRGDEQGVYTVSMTLGRNSLSPHGHITVSFDCDPERQDKLVSAVIEELRHLQDVGPTADEAAGIAAALAELQARNLKSTSANSYWLFFLLEAYKGERLRVARGAERQMDQKNIEATANAASVGYADRVARLVTSEKLQETFKTRIHLDNYVQLVLEPDCGPESKRATDHQAAAKRPRL